MSKKKTPKEPSKDAAEKAPEEPTNEKPTFTLRIPGTETTEALTALSADSRIRIRAPKDKDGKKLPPVHKKIQFGVARGATTSVAVANVAPGDAVCLHFADGMKLWMSAGELADRAEPGGSRGPQAEAGCYDISPALFGEGSERGALGVAVTALEVFGVDLAGLAASDIAGWFEAKQLADREGVYPVDLAVGEAPLFGARIAAPAVPVDGGQAAADGGNGAPAPAVLANDGEPLLVFLHGTASSFTGSFGKLWQPGSDEAARKRKEARTKLAARYAGRCYALEHRSLTVSPIDNALALVECLPVGAELHLVSHSRGGLVGELLCLGERSGTALSAEMLDLLYRDDRTQADLMGFGQRDAGVAAAYGTQRGKLGELLQQLDDKKIRVTRFVRVACPAMGTTLASGRLDRWLSLLTFAAGDGIVGDIRDFILAVINKRTDPRSLPGLEAMMPGSALVRLLNLDGLRVNADLSVIAGDCGDKSLWDRLKFAVSDWFFGGDHDLVVNTGSMYGGARRLPKAARKYFTQGGAVNHFHYFTNPDTVEKLVSGLQDGDGLRGFDPLEALDRKAPARAAPRQFTGPHPLAFVLPGIMGSTLAAQGEEIWLSKAAVFRGEMKRLAIDSGEEIKAVTPLEQYYGDFIEFLGRTHEVIPFPYDWRRSVAENAKLLNAAIRARLPEAESGRQPIRIVAHSMGGLVARAMLGQDEDTWNRLKKLDGFRLMMLGTPNYGAYQAVRLVVGQYRLANLLALLDIRHGRDEHLALFSRFPGALELLPWKNEGNLDFASSELWAQLKNDVDESWPLPDRAALRRAAATWTTLNTAPIDKERMIYVAGQADKTPCGYRIRTTDDFIRGNRAQIEFLATRRGDGTVTWDRGCLPGVPTWYVEAEHGDLLAQSDYFPAYLELLQTGKTTRLPASEPAKSRGLPSQPEFFPLPPDLAEGFDDLDGLGGFGAGKPGAGSGRRRLPGVRVGIKSGDLAYASNPVCVGHYQGDTVVSAEALLDKAIDKALSNRQHMGIYPGKLGSWEVFIQENPRAKPGGALVVGLGQVGDLTPGGLESAIARAMSDYALQVMQWHDDRFGARKAVRSARMSFLLIGTGAGGIEVRSSVEAILRGVKHANEKLVESKLDHRVLIDHIEILELYQDIAIQAARALDEVLADPVMAAHFTWEPREIAESNGQRRVLCEEAPNWWQRLEIVQDEQREELRFIALTNRARAEETLVAGDLRLAKDFIRQSIADTLRSREISRTLFEMLIPHRLKQLAPDRRNMVLVVDENSAAYPWEMLEDRWTDGKEPLAVVAGMVRQFKTHSFRGTPAHADDDAVFVVGNPLQTHFGNLPGARDEAEEVVRALSAGGFRVRQSIESGADSIMIGLHADAYRILHLAGHGVHEWTVKKAESCDSCRQDIPDSKKTVSGMVIGDETFLTADDVRQMRWVPELVFINCCHLGNTRKSTKAARKFNYLSANLAVEFINMGVKAVVAAGWAVNDAAARLFATHFYQRMLADEPFGLAVQGARKAVFDAYPNLNTWGAYQCYGDPDFRLYNKANGTAKPAPAPFYTRAELVVALENLARSERTGHGDANGIEALLARIPGRLADEWRKEADVLGALGYAYSEFGDLEKAVECLDKAAQAEKSSMPLRLLEKRANFKARLAARLAGVAHDEKIQARIDGLFNQAFAEIGTLLALAATPERHNLRASAWKRKAMVSDDANERAACLTEMRNSYQAAEALFHAWQQAEYPNEAERKPTPYSTLNKWTAEILLAPQLDTAKLQEECGKAASWAEAQDIDKPGFRLATVLPDSLLLAALAQKDLAGKQDEIIAAYRIAWERGASKRAFDSVLDQFAFLEKMLPACGAADQLGELQKIAAALRQFTYANND